MSTPASYNQLSSVVPGVLKLYDLPELVATLAPRSLTIKNSVDAALRPVALIDLGATYRVCHDAYAARGQDEALALRATNR